ncbi:MAG: hypothetical protein R3248_03385 [Candidatus Promineifilaceae bacterium]|nr:hypothetical protein [Candidatus Promineifilaceae bacterium]
MARSRKGKMRGGRRSRTGRSLGDKMRGRARRVTRKKPARAAKVRGGTGAARRKTRARSRPAVGRRSRAASSPAKGGAADVQRRISQLQNRFSRLETSAELSDLTQTVGRLEQTLAELPRDLEKVRSRGYLHAGRLENEIASLRQQWQQTQPRVESALNVERNRLRRELRQATPRVNALSPHDPDAITAATAAISSLQSRVNNGRNNVRSLYNPLLRQVQQLDHNLGRVEQMLERFHRSPGVRLQPTEGPLLATEARWRRSGDEGPQGVLFLTDQRLLFEQNEEVAKEKFLGLFTTKSEQVQRLLLDVPAHAVEKMEHAEEGGFLGIGESEILELVLSARAPVSRASFELKKEDAEEWVSWLKRVQTGQVDDDRAEAFAKDVEEAEALAASFPSQCPMCFAPLPRPPRGADHTRCEYCNAVVGPEAPAEPDPDIGEEAS